MHIFWINKKLLPIKLHYYLGISGTAPIMCFLPTLIKQRGYSAGIAGLIFTLLMLPDVLIRPTVGFLTDKYKCRKSGLIACLITCILMVVILFLLPGATVENEMDNMDVIRSPLFWLFTGTVVLMKSGIMARCVLEDTICISLLGENKHKYGEQRMWGAFGWGSMSVFSGLCIDWYSKGQKYKNYLPSFILSIIFYILDICVVSSIEVTQVNDSTMLQKGIKNIFTKIKIQAFLLWVVIFGALSAFIWFYLFWYLEDLANIYHPETKPWIKTIQGFSLTVQCFGGEIPFFLLSSFILKRVDHMNIFSLMFFVFSVRFFLYSIIRNPVLVFPVELMNGVTYALAYSALVSYANHIAPVGTEGTLQGIVGATFTGIGTPMGSMIGGYLFDTFGSINAFKILSLITLAICIIQIIINQLINRFSKNMIVDSESGGVNS